MSAPTVVVVVSAGRTPGRFTAKLASDRRVLVASSRTPFLAAARRLLRLGYPADATLAMRHAGSETESLRATIGNAAALTVKETEHGPAFRPYDGLPRLSATPPTAPDLPHEDRVTEVANTAEDGPK